MIGCFISAMSVQNRLTNDSMLFDRITATQLSRVNLNTKLFGTEVTGNVDFSDALVIGLLSDKEVTASSLGAGTGDVLSSADLEGNIVLRRLKAGTDISIDETSTNVDISLADNISRGSISFSGGATAGGTSSTNLNVSGNLQVNGPATLSGTVSNLPGLSSIWTPTTNGDLLTFGNEGEAQTHPASTSGGIKVLSRNTSSPTGLSWIAPTPQTITSVISPASVNEIAYTDGTILTTLAIPAATEPATNPTRPKYYLGYTNNLTLVDPSSSGGPTASGTLSNFAQDVACRSVNATNALGSVPTNRYVYLNPPGSTGAVSTLALTDATTAIDGADMVWKYADGSATITSGSTLSLSTYTMVVPGSNLQLRMLSSGDVGGQKVAIIHVLNSGSWDPTSVGTSSSSGSGTSVTITRALTGSAPNRSYSILYDMTTNGTGQSLLPIWNCVPDWPSYSSAMSMVVQQVLEVPIPVILRIGRGGTQSAPRLYVQVAYYFDNDNSASTNTGNYFTMITSR